MTELEQAVEHLRRHRRVSDDPEELALLLYQSWYARPRGPAEPPPGFPHSLVEILRAADRTTRRWEDGWRAERVSRCGSVVARRGREVRRVDRCDHIVPGAPGALARSGDSLLVAGRRDRLDPDGAWWRTAGGSWRFTRPERGLVRFYWNVELGHLPDLVSRLTEALAELDRPWMIKCAAAPAAHARADATVLYVTSDAVAPLRTRLDGIADAVNAHARSVAPPLALPIHPCVAVAFDPPDAESFGLHRCRLVAEALGEGPVPDGDAALAAIRVHLARGGVAPDRLHAARTDPPLPWER